jgi:hypothetical protein
MLRAFAIGVLVAVLSVANVHANDLDELKGGPIWGYCESYFVKAKDERVRRDNYVMRDVSLEFLRAAKTLKPRTKPEAYLLIECINLANGNAVSAQDAIQKTYGEDDEFFEDLLVDATNNSNASQHKYVSELQGKYDFKNQIQAGQHVYQARIKAAQAEAIMQAAQILGIATGGLLLAALASDSSGGGNAMANAATFSAFAAATTQIYAVSTNAPQAARSGAARQSASAVQTNIANVTLAPIGDSARESTAPNPNIEYSAAPAEAPVEALTPPAPHIKDRCVSYRVVDEYRSVAEVSNNCAVPVVFYWCWLKSAQTGCQPNEQTAVIEPKKRANIAGPGANQSTSAMYVVCDMSERGRVCKL